MKGNYLPLCPNWQLWGLCGVVVLIDVVWLSLSPITMHWFGSAVLAVIGTVCLAWHYAGYFIPLRDGPRLFASGLAFTVLSWKPLAIFGYLMMTLPVPIADPLLANWDRALGFDWTSYLTWVAARPWASHALLWVYRAILPLPILAFIILHFSGRPGRASEYLALSFIGALIAITVGAAFPSFGTVTYLQAPRELMAVFPAHTGSEWVQRLTELRSGVPIDTRHMVGLVSFPSYHVALTLIIVWCFRGFRLLFPICAVYALGTAASAPIMGGHYFVDLVAGAALVCIMIMLGKIWRTSPALRSRRCEPLELLSRCWPRHRPNSRTQP